MIIVEQVSKDYVLFDRPADALRSVMSKRFQYFRALDGVSFHARQGEVIGLIGPNGAGKSTLLKLIAGISKPTSGRISVTGRISSILELATGFSPHLSGRENVRRALALRGLSSRQIQKLEEDIIESSELQGVIDQPVRSYSSGMGAKLAFSVAVASVHDVVLIDEILSVGDEHFQAKSLGKIHELCSSGRTVVISSHAIPYVERLCDRVIWLEHGKVKLDGPAHEVTMTYFSNDKDSVLAAYPREFGEIDAVETEFIDSKLRVSCVINRKQLTDRLHVQIGVYDSRGGILAGLFNTAWKGNAIPRGPGRVKVNLEFPAPAGLKKGLVSAVLARGSGAIPGSIVEDCRGWSDGRQVYFSNPDQTESTTYLKEKLSWKQLS